MEGADRYNVYYDSFFDSGCSVRYDGSTSFCDELAVDVVETTYLHDSPNTTVISDNYYWVASCAGDWCSFIDSSNPAKLVGPEPSEMVAAKSVSTPVPDPTSTPEPAATSAPADTPTPSPPAAAVEPRATTVPSPTPVQATPAPDPDVDTGAATYFGARRSGRATQCADQRSVRHRR